MENEVSQRVAGGVTALHWDKTLIACTTWEGTLHLIQPFANDNDKIKRTITNKAPLLDFAMLHTSQIVTADLNGNIALHTTDNTSSQAQVIGNHDAAARCVAHCTSINATVSGGWDGCVKIWDARAADACVGKIQQPNKVFGMCAGPTSTAETVLVVATAGRHVNVIDLRHPSEPVQKRESALKCQTRCVRQMPCRSGYILGSVSGRVAVEYFDPDAQVQAKRYAFKAHRSTVQGVDTTFPVNAIDFHPQFGTFATGGCDGRINVWDKDNRKRVCQYKGYPTSIAALEFSPSATEYLAFAVSYTYENGPVAHPPDELRVRKVAQSEVKARHREKATR